jgi:hypothetical protein
MRGAFLYRNPKCSSLPTQEQMPENRKRRPVQSEAHRHRRRDEAQRIRPETVVLLSVC